MRILTIKNKKDLSVLRQKLPFFDLSKAKKSELREVIKQMRAAMKAAPGVGLAANQVGRTERLFVAQVPKSRDSTSDEKFYAILNPKIVKLSEGKIIEEEGCLSVPETYGAVPRAEKVVLEGETLEGKKIRIKAWGLLARVFQHEVDHLDGKTFLDRTKEIYKVEADRRR
ncbi:MAG: Peptide deformylase [Candidatus Jorgensenbacteria bacterium GW2011_GWA1_48_13]|uniref:Peptide deformylase n=1 Tax=Candidatus Jorgensenbacteria bacterium GW2011_GWB1_50_10 TaxID=1618665 RepID=A0A0G1Z787_9BACT|nr:MAG: Peptide deformylase [Candidatus Jorgensenbacteria bacterium GW2011_GWA1_48_13]KKW14794.1 MAG: Peptide deformylase [Candidatus Jorgensenbacteria bacterium GW2011_GWB1_50_10]